MEEDIKIKYEYVSEQEDVYDIIFNLDRRLLINEIPYHYKTSDSEGNRIFYYKFNVKIRKHKMFGLYKRTVWSEKSCTSNGRDYYVIMKGPDKHVTNVKVYYTKALRDYLPKVFSTYKVNTEEIKRNKSPFKEINMNIFL
jgi:hypothetical protein